MAHKSTTLKTFRNIVLTLGTVLALFFVLAFVPKIISSFTDTSHTPLSGRGWEGQIVTAMFVVFMLGYIIGWWRRLWGGILILLAAIIVTAPFIILASNFGALIFGIPIFLIGVLYILLNWVEKSRAVKKEETA